MTDDPVSGWHVIVPAFVVSAAPTIWGAIKWLRGERRADRSDEMTLQAKMDATQLERQKVLNEESEATITRSATAYTNLYNRFIAVEKDRDRGWDLARWWRRTAIRVQDAAAQPGYRPENAETLPGLEEPK